MKVVLIGYMASGKSAVGKLLAKKLNIQYIDLDNFIEKKEELTISEIFKTKGEIYFRKKEGEYLKEILKLNENLVISLGGGTPCYGNSMEIIEKNANSFYLKASIHKIFERLKNGATTRPLVATIGLDNLKEYIAKHLFERAVFYERANHTISVNDKSIPKIVKEIESLL
jgi:shikimate kinase